MPNLHTLIPISAPQSPPLDGYAPFSSLTGRENLPGVDGTIVPPGPGQYDPQVPKNYVKGGRSMANRSSRFKPKIMDTPGPGSYQVCVLFSGFHIRL